MDINRIYTVYNTSDVNDVPIQKIANYIRYSLDGTQLIVEWIDTPPDDVTIIDHETAVSLTQTSEWNPPDDITE
jgi:hypothetical protein